MKARILSSGKIVKVYRTNEQAISVDGVVRLYKDYDGREHWSNEIEIVPDDVPLSDEQTITIMDLRGVLDACIEVGYINEYGAQRIVELIKHKTL